MTMKTSNRIAHLVDDLAALWTEPTLEILNDAGNAPASVDSEIDAWHNLSAAIHTALRRQFASFNAVREQVFGQVIAALARKYNLWLTSHEVDEQIHSLIQERRPTAAEREIFSELG